MVDYTEIIFVLSKILLALTCMGTVWLLLFSILNTRDSHGGRVLILLSLTSLAWSAALFANLFITSATLDRAIYAFSVIAASAVALFAYTFPDSRPKGHTLYIIAPAFFIALLSFVPGFIFWNNTYRPEGISELATGPGYFIFHLVFLGYLSVALLRFHSRRVETHNATLRQQFIFLEIGTALFALFALVASIIMGGFLDASGWNIFGPTVALGMAMITYGVLRQYYYVDLKNILYGIIGKISLFLLAGLTYLIALLVIGTLARGHNILTYHVAFIITMLTSLKLAPIISKEAIALAAGPREKANKESVTRFVIDLFEHQHTAAEISNATVQLCADILNAKNGKLITQSTGNERELALLEKIKLSEPSLLDEPTILLLETASGHEIASPTQKEKLGEELRNIHQAGLVATLSSQHTLYGILILGERRDARGYSKQDVELIKEILLPLSSALAETTFRAQITLLTTSSDNTAGKLREELFARDTKNKKLIGELEHTTYDALHTLRHKLEAIRSFGVGAIGAAIEALEKTTKEFENQIKLLREENERPVIVHTDLSPLFHKLIEIYGSRALLQQSHLAYEIPETVPAVGDPQQIHEAFSLLFQDVFSEECSKDEYIFFGITIDANNIKILLTQKYLQATEELTEEERTRRKTCIKNRDYFRARFIFEQNGGTLRQIEESDMETKTLITLIRDTSEDKGGIAT